MSDSPEVKSGFKLFNLIYSKSTTNKYNEITDILIKSKLKVLIFIDDTDRLSHKEIIEVFRLVRNTANFPYLQFIITYDRNFVIKSLDFPMPEKFIQKIFNMEISLPTYDIAVVRKSLFDKIVEYLPFNGEQQATIERFLFSFDDDFPVEKIIVTQRDVIRFVNSLLLNFEALANSQESESLDDLNVLDFIKLELIRYYSSDYFDKLTRDPMSELNAINETYCYKNDKRGKSDSDEPHVVNLLNEIADRNSRYIKEEEILSVCMNNLFPQSQAQDKSSIASIRSFLQYFQYRFDEKNITVAEIVELLTEKDTQRQIIILDEYWTFKKSKEIQYMIDFIISRSRNPEWFEEEQSPFFYKNVLAFLHQSLQSSNEELKQEIAHACVPLYQQPKFRDIDYYIEVLKLWDRTLKFNVLKDVTFVLGFLSKDNLQKKLGGKSAYANKIELLLRGSTSTEELSSLLFSIVNSDNELPDLVLDKQQLRSIQESFFDDYSKFSRVDSTCLSLFQSCAIVEPGSRKLSWERAISDKMFGLVKADPQGYISLCLVMDHFYIYPPKYWKPIFNHETEKFEKYLFDDHKNTLKRIDEVKKIWSLYKHNDYSEIALNSLSITGLATKELIIHVSSLLSELLTIQDEVNKMKKGYDDASPEAEVKRIEQLKDFEEKIDKNPLNISLCSKLKWEVQLLRTGFPYVS